MEPIVSIEGFAFYFILVCYFTFSSLSNFDTTKVDNKQDNLQYFIIMKTISDSNKRKKLQPS